MKCRRLLIFALTCLLSNRVRATDFNYRLNTPILPSEYQILLKPYFDTGDANQFTFDGAVSIRFSTNASTKQIKFHSEELSFSLDDVIVAIFNTGITLAIDGLEFNPYYTFAYINLVEDLEPGIQYVVQIKYRGRIRSDLNGFYRNHYYQNGTKKWLGTSQLEPTHARKVFPCFDEPEMKAAFVLGIDRPEHYQPSRANTHMERTETLGNGYIREIFYPTPRMSTYLVAFLISELEAAAVSIEGTEEFGVYTRPDAKNQSAFGFEFGKKVVNALGEYYGISYYSSNSHLGLDHVALPDFRVGAMENWGLVTYREAHLLYVPEHSTPYFKYKIAQVIAHETAHLYFGDLVTCHWWSNAWLNEGFASYFQDYITVIIEPEVGAANQMVIGTVYNAYDVDSSPTSAPISNNNVNSPDEISANFGMITYQKGGAVIRMIHHLIQDEAFKYGLNFYLKNNSFGSGYPDLLYQSLDEGISNFNALSSYPGATIAAVMSSWINQPGHPLLTVYIDYDTEIVTLAQKRYYSNGSLSSNEIYMIPITYTTQLSPDFENTKPVLIMNDTILQFKIPDIGRSHSWVIFNVQETGVYRVNYDDHTWSLIISALKGNGRDHITSSQSCQDEVPFSTLYSALEFLPEEPEYPVWFAAVRGFTKLRNLYLGDKEVLPAIEEFILRHLDHGISRLGYQERSTDSFEDLRNRMQILELACKLGHIGCVEETVALFKSLRYNGTEISPSLRPVAYCTGLRHGDADDFDFLWNRMLNHNVASEVWIIVENLGCTSDEEKLRSYLASVTLEDTPIKTQDQTVPLTSVLGTYSNLHIVMDALISNYTQWSTTYPSMGSILSTVSSALHTENDFNEFESFLSTCTDCTEATKTAAKSSLALARSSTLWASTHKEDILKSFHDNNFANAAVPSIIMLLLGLIVVVFTEY